MTEYVFSSDYCSLKADEEGPEDLGLKVILTAFLVELVRGVSLKLRPFDT